MLKLPIYSHFSEATFPTAFYAMKINDSKA